MEHLPYDHYIPNLLFMEGKKTLGKRKIRMQKIENKSNLQVTFSKRRAGLFKKAAELSAVCVAEIAVLVQSPGGKIFAFGSPSVESILRRFQMGGTCDYSWDAQIRARENYERSKYMEALRELEQEKDKWMQHAEVMELVKGKAEEEEEEEEKLTTTSQWLASPAEQTTRVADSEFLEMCGMDFQMGDLQWEKDAEEGKGSGNGQGFIHDHGFAEFFDSIDFNSF